MITTLSHDAEATKPVARWEVKELWSSGRPAIPLDDSSRTVAELPLDYAIVELESTEMTKPLDVTQEYDWNNNKVSKEFIRLQQKVLAGIATPEEGAQYHSMKLDRNSTIFADRYVQNYAEAQRLRTLQQKLADLSQYLKPLIFK